MILRFSVPILTFFVRIKTHTVFFYSLGPQTDSTVVVYTHQSSRLHNCYLQNAAGCVFNRIIVRPKTPKQRSLLASGVQSSRKKLNFARDVPWDHYWTSWLIHHTNWRDCRRLITLRHQSRLFENHIETGNFPDLYVSLGVSTNQKLLMLKEHSDWCLMSLQSVHLIGF